MIVSVNPYKRLNIYGEELIPQYQSHPKEARNSSFILMNIIIVYIIAEFNSSTPGIAAAFVRVGAKSF